MAGHLLSPQQHRQDVPTTWMGICCCSSGSSGPATSLSSGGPWAAS